MKDVDIGAALRRLADKRIEEAIEAGKFDNLAGAGQPLELEPMPADEEARAMYWAIRLLRNAEVTTDEMRLRKEAVERREQVATATTEAEIRRLVREYNALVKRLNTLGTNAIRTTATMLGPLDEEREARRLATNAPPMRRP